MGTGLGQARRPLGLNFEPKARFSGPRRRVRAVAPRARTLGPRADGRAARRRGELADVRRGGLRCSDRAARGRMLDHGGRRFISSERLHME
eukprot:6185566-Pleurochrysis_carterae.AAC.2